MRSRGRAKLNHRATLHSRPVAHPPLPHAPGEDSGHWRPCLSLLLVSALSAQGCSQAVCSLRLGSVWMEEQPALPTVSAEHQCVPMTLCPELLTHAGSLLPGSTPLLSWLSSLLGATPLQPLGVSTHFRFLSASKTSGCSLLSLASARARALTGGSRLC